MAKIHIYVYQVVKCSDGNYYYYRKPLCAGKAIKFGSLDIIKVVGEYSTAEEAHKVTNELNKAVKV